MSTFSWLIRANADPEVVSDKYGYVQWRGVSILEARRVWEDPVSKETIIGGVVSKHALKTVDTYPSWESAAEGAMELAEAWLEANKQRQPSFTKEITLDE